MIGFILGVAIGAAIAGYSVRRCNLTRCDLCGRLRENGDPE